MIKEFNSWLLETNLATTITHENQNEYFDMFIELYYNNKTTSYVIKDILKELYKLGITTYETRLLLESIRNEEMTKFLQGLSHGQENEKSNKKNTKSRVNAKESGKGKCKVDK